MIFRRTVTDLARVERWLAEGETPEAITSRLMTEGCAQDRVAWLVQRARHIRRADNAKRVAKYVALFGVGAFAMLTAIAARMQSIATAVAGSGIFAIAMATIYVCLAYRDHVRGFSALDWDPSGVISEELRTAPPRRVRASTPTLPFVILGLLALAVVALGVYHFSPTRHPTRAVFELAIGALLLLWLPFFSRTLRNRLTFDRDLAANGRAVEGEVIEFHRRFWVVRYRFTAGGRVIEAEAGLRRMPSIFPARGDRLVILYDDEDPERNAPAIALAVEFESS